MKSKPSFRLFRKTLYNTHKTIIYNDNGNNYIEKYCARRNTISKILFYVTLLLLNAIYILIIKKDDNLLWYEILGEVVLVFILTEIVTLIRYLTSKFEFINTNIGDPQNNGSTAA